MDPLGYVHVCQGVTIGNLFQQPLKEICEAYDPESHPICGPLLDGGPAALVTEYGLPHREAYADACHLCYEARLGLRSRVPRDPGARSNVWSRRMKGNDFVKLMLRSPLHGLLGNTMLITVKGRKTGREISVPVNYYRDGDTLWIISTRARTWWRNISTGSPVRLRLHGRDIAANGRTGAVTPAPWRQRAAAYVRRFPSSRRGHWGSELEDGVPNDVDIQRVARERLFVAVCTQDVSGLAFSQLPTSTVSA